MATAGTAALYALNPEIVNAKTDVPKKWDKIYNVVVIGYGGAGACAAITAHDAGSKVLILEKMHEGGGNTAVSSGGLFKDKARAEGGAVNGPSQSGYIRNKENFKWSRGNLAKIEKGYILKADSVEELAKKIKIDPKVLQKTVDKWNSDVKVGEDTLYHRSMVNKLDESKAAYKDGRHTKVLSASIEKDHS